MKILVLGATGLLGNAMFRSVSASGARVNGTIRKEAARGLFAQEHAGRLTVVEDIEDPVRIVRLFDASFTLDDIRATTVTLRVEGLDQYVLEGSSSIAKISRDPADLVAQMVSAHHRYPDGAVLFLGTMFAPRKLRRVSL